MTRILILAPLFSGLEASVDRGAWRPAGVPAFVKLLEALAADEDVDTLTLFGCDNPAAKQVHGPITAAIGEHRFIPRCDQGFRQILSGTRQALAAYRRFRPDVVLAYNAMFVPAGLLGRLGRQPVVMRFLGIHPFHHSLAAKPKLHPFRWLFGAPFAQAICTMDGSGGSVVLPKLLGRSVPLKVLLNGVEREQNRTGANETIEPTTASEDEPLKCVFLGRLEPNKGILEFIQGVCSAASQTPGKIRATIVGDGSLRSEAVALIDREDSTGSIEFLGSVSQDEVAGVLRRQDLYISANKFGSLSNATLEALAEGLALAILSPDPVTYTDVDTHTVIPQDAAERIDRTAIAASLATILQDLVGDRDRVRALKGKARIVADTHLGTWRERVAQEIDFLKSAATGHPGGSPQTSL